MKRWDLWLRNAGVVAGVMACVNTLPAQNVGINYTGTPPHEDALLDLSISTGGATGTKRGLLIPRVALAGPTDQNFGPSAGNNPVSLLVYHTGGGGLAPGFYYWDGTQWRPFLTGANIGGTAWLITGNTGTNPPTNFLGTIDAKDLVFKTSNTERMRITSGGRTVVNNTTPFPGDVFSSYGAGVAGAITNTDSTAIAGYGRGINYPTAWIANLSGGIGMYGTSFSGIATLGYTYGGAGGIGVMGLDSTSTTSTAVGVGVYGEIMGKGYAGFFYAGHPSNSYPAVYAESKGSGDGVISIANNTNALAVLGQNAAFPSTGIAGAGNNQAASIPSAGAGGAFTSTSVGVYGKATSITGAAAVVGLGDNLGTYYYLTEGSGGAFTGDTVGVYGIATMPGGYGGYFYGGNPPNVDNNNIGVVGVVGSGTEQLDFVGVLGVANAASGWGYGVVGQGNWYGVYAYGDLGASGLKPFVIDHPLDPENKYLKHFAIESPEVLNAYRGVVTLDQNGEAVVELPAYFEKINKNYSYHLTPIG